MKKGQDVASTQNDLHIITSFLSAVLPAGPFKAALFPYLSQIIWSYPLFIDEETWAFLGVIKC